MILTHSEIQSRLSNPAYLSALATPQDEREFLAEFGMRPVLDDLMECLASGQAYDSSERDVHYAAVMAVLKGQRAQYQADMDEFLDGLE